MATLAWSFIILSALGSMTAFGLFLANVMTTGNIPFILWIQSVPPIGFLAVFVAFLILIGVLLRPKPRRH